MGDKGKGNGLTLEITDGITEHANRVALKGVFSAFGDVLACWVPPIDRRGADNASVRFAVAQAAESAKQACDAGQVFFQGLPLKVKWRSGGGPRVGNSDIGGTVGGNSPTRPSIRDGKGGGGKGGRDGKGGQGPDRRDGRDRDRRRRSRSRGRRRSRSRDREEGAGEMVWAHKALEAEAPPPMGGPQYGMPPELMMQAMGQPPPGMLQQGQPPPGMFPPGHPGAVMPGAASIPPQAVPEPIVRIPTAAEIEEEKRRKKEAQARRAAQLKRGPGVAALVQGALKQAQTATVVKKAEEDVLYLEEVERKAKEQKKKEEEEAERAKQPPKKTKEELERERQEQERKEEEERQRLEREALEREREKARQAQLEAEREEERLKAEAANREARVKAGVEAAKKQQAARERGTNPATGKMVMGPANLYGDMPDPNLETEDAEAARRKEEEKRKAQKNLNLPPEDISKVVFLDIDGVLRPARAGGFDVLSESKEAVNLDTSDFFPSAMKALRHIMERTGAIIVLSSEWRRSEALRDALDDVLQANRIRPASSGTPVDIEETKMPDPVRAFAERRAREVSAWLREHEDAVKGYVVLDDINLAIADEEKKPTSKSMGPKLVQTWPLCGLTMGNAKTAVRILNGEMIHKVLVERPKAPGGMATPMPGGRV